MRNFEVMLGQTLNHSVYNYVVLCNVVSQETNYVPICLFICDPPFNF